MAGNFDRDRNQFQSNHHYPAPHDIQFPLMTSIMFSILFSIPPIILRSILANISGNISVKCSVGLLVYLPNPKKPRTSPGLRGTNSLAKMWWRWLAQTTPSRSNNKQTTKATKKKKRKNRSPLWSPEDYRSDPLYRGNNDTSKDLLLRLLDRRVCNVVCSEQLVC